MPDFTVTITTVEAGVLASYFPTTQEGIEFAVRRLVQVRAKDLIFDSSSIKDPRKMDDQGLRDELLVIQSEVPTFCERYPDHPACIAASTTTTTITT